MRDSDWFPNDGEENVGQIFQRGAEELHRIPNAVPDDEGLVTGPVMALRDLIVYPNMISPIFIARKQSLLAIEEAQNNNQTVIAITQLDAKIDSPEPEDLYRVGVEVAIGNLLTLPDGSNSALVQGRRRVEIFEFLQTEPFARVRARPIISPKDIDQEMEALMRTVMGMFERCVQLNRSLPEEAYLFALNIDDPGWLADMVASAIAPTVKERQRMLETYEPRKRLNLVSEMLANEVDVLELEDKIHTRVQKEVNRNQREMYLREQLKAIQMELGEGDIWSSDLAEIENLIEGANLPEESYKRALKELNRLSQMPPMSPEVGVIRTYIDWIVELPWTEKTEDNLDIMHASGVLDQHHYGLPRAKDRILEYLAVRSLKPKKNRQPILCFVGAPGTGKTSLGQSIAKALERKFVRLSLGGVRDEAEIRGHRRTYIGALPGRILQTMRRAKTINPLFMLDEIDKLGTDYRGDPASALLEVLDPEQNHAFSDHYLEIPFDLSQVMFITTANTRSTIPWALLDRMEVIEFPGYIEEEKIEIARQFLIPRQLEESGLETNEVHYTESALIRVIREYTYEAGVRNLEREIGQTYRKIARLKASDKPFPSRVGANSLEKYLGPPKFFDMEAEGKDEIGVATSLAWTDAGGDISPVEVVLIDGKGTLQITGHIGDVMQESAQAGLSYLKSRATDLNVDSEIFERTDVHIHIPEGAIPKDGPSAGITIATALISAFTGRMVRKEVGMTGEITLRGRVLPIGGVREKILAAHRAGLKTVILPKRNQKDLVEIPKKVRGELSIKLVTHIDEVIEISLCSPDETRPTPSRRKTDSSSSKGQADTPSGQSIQPGA